MALDYVRRMYGVDPIPGEIIRCHSSGKLATIPSYRSPRTGMSPRGWMARHRSRFHPTAMRLSREGAVMDANCILYDFAAIATAAGRAIRPVPANNASPMLPPLSIWVDVESPDGEHLGLGSWSPTTRTTRNTWSCRSAASGEDRPLRGDRVAAA